jgi:hypothetical protein
MVSRFMTLTCMLFLSPDRLPIKGFTALNRIKNKERHRNTSEKNIPAVSLPQPADVATKQLISSRRPAYTKAA